MSRERSGSGTCYTCKEPLVGQKCICRSCLENPIQGLGDLYAKRRELIIKSSELQESLRVLMKGQVGLQFLIFFFFKLSWQDLVATSDAAFVPTSHCRTLKKRNRLSYVFGATRLKRHGLPVREP